MLPHSSGFFISTALESFVQEDVTAPYQQRHGPDDGALAALLGRAPDVLTALRLCRRPGEAAPARTAGEDVATIARRFGLDAGALRRVVEEGTG
jgi:hypothetical protein